MSLLTGNVALVYNSSVEEWKPQQSCFPVEPKVRLLYKKIKKLSVLLAPLLDHLVIDTK